MITLARFIWPSLAAVLAVGLVFGWRSFRPGRIGWPRGLLLAVALLVLGAAGVASALQLVPERAGVWLDSGVLHAGLYALGCALGWLAARVTASRRQKPTA